MRLRLLCALAIAAHFSLPLQAMQAPKGEASPPLVPYPRSWVEGAGALKLEAAGTIACAAPDLLPLARVLSREIHLCSGLELKATGGTEGAIVLKLDPSVSHEEGYVVRVAPEGAVVAGRTYRGVAWGTVTLLQALQAGKEGVRIPSMKVEDEPVAPYRGLLVDVARRWHSTANLRSLIDLCRLYKINYLQLHLNDQQSTVFPFEAYPALATARKVKENGKERPLHYTPEEIRGLVRYADERGVTLVPELEGPGHHSGSLRNLWGKGSCLNTCSEETYRGMAVLVKELCDVFASSPYIHIGADECSMHSVDDPEAQAYMREHGLKGKGDAYLHYIRRMRDIVAAHGKKTLVWEGFHGDGGGIVPKDVIVMPFESLYNPPQNLVRHGFAVINTAWKPLYVVNARHWEPGYIYDHWNMRLWEHHMDPKRRIQLKPQDPVLGAQLCSWEQREEQELPSLRERLAAMSERVWTPGLGRPYSDFAPRAARTDGVLDRMHGVVAVRAEGVGSERDREFYRFEKSLRIHMTWPPIGDVHYTVNGGEPTVDSPKYASPLELTRKDARAETFWFNSRTKRDTGSGEVIRIRARIFDGNGRPRGDVVTLASYVVGRVVPVEPKKKR